jgi:hypothetical protein
MFGYRRDLGSGVWQQFRLGQGCEQGAGTMHSAKMATQRARVRIGIRPEACIKILRFAVQASVSILELRIACTETLDADCCFQLVVEKAEKSIRISS